MENIVPANFFKPSELLGIFKNYFGTGPENNKIITLSGIYLKSEKIYGQVAFDKLKDEVTPEEITIKTPVSLRDDLKNGNLVFVQGILDRTVRNDGSIQFVLNVSRVNKIKDIAISDDEVKRAEARRRKGERGYKNVDGTLESILFKGERPRVALIYAEGSITNADFNKGLQSASANIDFVESRVSFARPNDLCALLKRLDKESHSVIAIVRGGGSGLEKLDDVDVCETLALLETPWIYGVGHEKENLFIRNLADKVIPIPFALGTFFRDIVEAVIQKRNASRAVLVQEVKSQYEKQIADANKANIELNKRIEALQKLNKEQAEASNKQIEALTKSQNESQRQIKEQTEAFRKTSEEAAKSSAAQIESAKKANADLQTQLEKQGKTLSEFRVQQARQQEQFAKSLADMQMANKQLTDSLATLTAQKAEAERNYVASKEQLMEVKEKFSKMTKNLCTVASIAAVIGAAAGAILTSILLF